MNVGLIIFIIGVVLLLFPPKQFDKDFYQTMTAVIIVFGLLYIAGYLVFS